MFNPLSGNPKRRDRRRLFLAILFAVVAMTVTFTVFDFATPGSSKNRSEFMCPLPIDSRRGRLPDLPRTFSLKISITDAVSEYANLTGRSSLPTAVFWLRSKDDFCRRFLRKIGIAQGIESICKTKLPSGDIEFARQPKSRTDKPVSLNYETTEISSSVWRWTSPSLDSDHLVFDSPSRRVLDLWEALRNEGVELQPVGTNRIRAIWHPSGPPKPR